MSFLCKLATAANIPILMVDSTDHVTGKAGIVTLTITASKDGNAFASITPVVTDLNTGWYNLALTTVHTNTKGRLALHITGTGADPTDISGQVVTDLPGDSVNVANSLATQAKTDVENAIWDADVVTGHGTANTSGLVISQLTKRAVTINTDVAVNSIIGHLKDDGVTSFARATDSLEALRAGGASPTTVATAVWANATRSLTDRTGYSLTQAFPANFSSMVIDASGRIDLGTVLGAAINALISGRLDVNAQVVGDKTGYSLAGGVPANFGALAIDASGRVDVGFVQGHAINAPISGRMDVNVGAMDGIIEATGNYTGAQILRIVLSALAGITTNSGATLKTPDGTVTRITATVDASNNRTAMTLTP